MFTNTSWAEKETTATIIAYAVAYGGFAQMVAGVLEVRCCGWLLRVIGTSLRVC